MSGVEYSKSETPFPQTEGMRPESPAPEGGDQAYKVPEKFIKNGQVDLDAFAKSYAELEREHSRGKPEEPKATESKPTEQPQTPRSIKDVLTEENMTKWGQEYQEQGHLSDDGYKALEEAGIPRFMADQWAVGQIALQQLAAQRDQPQERKTRFLAGKGDATTVEPFASTYEHQQARRDPRYGRDPNYTNEVHARLKATPKGVLPY